MNALEQAFRPLYGQPCWHVQKGIGSFLTLEFGQPALHITEPTPRRKRRVAVVHGEWHLWVYCCDWQYWQERQCLSTNASSTKTIRRAAMKLNGQALVNASITARATVLEFDLGGRLELVYNATDYDDLEKTEQWMLYEPAGYVYTLRADGHYSHHPGTDTANEVWVALPTTAS